MKVDTDGNFITTVVPPHQLHGHVNIHMLPGRAVPAKTFWDYFFDDLEWLSIWFLKSSMALLTIACVVDFFGSR